jgi:hypothetical protein
MAKSMYPTVRSREWPTGCGASGALLRPDQIEFRRKRLLLILDHDLLARGSAAIISSRRMAEGVAIYLRRSKQQ